MGKEHPVLKGCSSAVSVDPGEHTDMEGRVLNAPLHGPRVKFLARMYRVKLSRRQSCAAARSATDPASCHCEVRCSSALVGGG